MTGPERISIPSASAESSGPDKPSIGNCVSRILRYNSRQEAFRMFSHFANLSSSIFKAHSSSRICCMHSRQAIGAMQRRRASSVQPASGDSDAPYRSLANPHGGLRHFGAPVFRVRHSSYTQPPVQTSYHSRPPAAWPVARRPVVAVRHGDTVQAARYRYTGVRTGGRPHRLSRCLHTGPAQSRSGVPSSQ